MRTSEIGPEVARVDTALDKKSSTLPRSGGKPGVPSGAAPLGWKSAFTTLRLLNALDYFTLKAIRWWDHDLNSNQLEVRKVGLPPLLLPFVQSVLTPLRLSA